MYVVVQGVSWILFLSLKRLLLLLIFELSAKLLKKHKVIIIKQILKNLRLCHKKILAPIALIAAGGPKAGHTDLCSRSLESAFYGQQKCYKIENLRCIWTMPQAINEPKRLLLCSFQLPVLKFCFLVRFKIHFSVNCTKI